jgi:hypothetical protein
MPRKSSIRRNLRELGSLRPLSELLGPLKSLATIAPPRKSLEEWGAFLKECDEAGISGVHESNDSMGYGFTTCLGLAFLWRWRWYQYAVKNGLSDDEAADLWQTYKGRAMPRQRPVRSPGNGNGAPAVLIPDPEADLLEAYAREQGLL